jgi:hypothetical protein
LKDEMMIDVLTLLFIAIGAVTFFLGYHKFNRNLMLVGAVFLTLSGGATDFYAGWIDGNQIKTPHQ